MHTAGEKCLDSTLDEATLGLIGQSRALDRIREQIRLAAAYEEPVLLVGESGTGKELVVRAVHALSGRSSRPLRTVNCGALTEDMLVAELFGHKAGAFTGARASRAGRIRAAHGSTLFLDEISETSTQFQVALLRVVDQGEVQPVGDDVSGQAVDVRFIAASNRPVAELERGTALRRDLFYRLSSFVIEVPPLRDRLEDIPLLVAHFASELTAKYGTEWEFSGPAIALLQEQRFPGNVRELRQAVFVACVSSETATVSAAHVRSVIGRSTSTQSGGRPFSREFALRPLLQRHLTETFLAAECNLSEAARMLRVPRSTLQYMLVRHGVDLQTVRKKAADKMP